MPRDGQKKAPRAEVSHRDDCEYDSNYPMDCEEFCINGLCDYYRAEMVDGTVMTG